MVSPNVQVVVDRFSYRILHLHQIFHLLLRHHYCPTSIAPLNLHQLHKIPQADCMVRRNIAIQFLLRLTCCPNHHQNVKCGQMSSHPALGICLFPARVF